MALENYQGASVLSSRKFPTGARALALVAMGLLAPGAVNAQPRHGRHNHETVPAAPATPTCALLNGTHTTQEWMSNAEALAACARTARSQLDALLNLRTATDEQQTAQAVRFADAFADMATAYTHVLSDASDFSPENVGIDHDLPFHWFFDFNLPNDVWIRFGTRMLANGNSILSASRRPGVSQNRQRELVAAAMGMHVRASQSLTNAQLRNALPATVQSQVAANLILANTHTTAEWQAFTDVTMATSRRFNARINITAGQPIGPPTSPQQTEYAIHAMDYYLQALNGYTVGLMTATDRATNPLPELSATSITFEPRVTYAANDWYFAANKLSGYAGNLSGSLANPTSRSRTHIEMLFRSVEASLHAINDSSNHGQLAPNSLNSLNFNIRALATQLSGVQLPTLPRVMPSNASSSVVAEVQADLATNNQRRRHNLQTALDLRNLSDTDKARMRLILINWLRLQDELVGAELRIIQDSLRPMAQQGLRICATNPGISGDSLRILRDFVCPSTGAIDFESFVSLATNPSLIASLPQRLAQVEGNLVYVNLVDTRTGSAQALPAALETVYRQWYLLHFIHHALEGLDRNIADTTHTESLMGTIRLIHPVSARTTTAALGELTATDTVSRVAVTTVQEGPLSNQGNNIAPRVLAMPETPAHMAWNAALAAHNRRATRLRIAGLTIGGVGLVTFGIAGAVNLAERGEATDLINTPRWQERVSITNMFVADAQAGRLDAAQIGAGNARTQMFAREYAAEVEAHNGTITASQIAAWTGLGIAVFGGALAALADIIAGPIPMEPQESVTPAAPGQRVPHPAPAGRRADSDETPGTTVIPNVAIGDGVQLGATVTF